MKQHQGDRRIREEQAGQDDQEHEARGLIAAGAAASITVGEQQQQPYMI